MFSIINARIITPAGVIEDGSLTIQNGVIVDVQEGGKRPPETELLDAGGNWLAPGFIDIHVHGGGGYDFMDNTVEAFHAIAELHAKHGTTAMLPTTLSSELADLYKTIDCYESSITHPHSGSRYLGLHLEGPYFAMEQRGAQDPRYIRNPDPEEYLAIMEKTNKIRRWSAAPELPGALEFADVCRSKGILPALAHTNAVYDEILNGLAHGYTLATHLYSAMSGITRKNGFRLAGAIESSLLLDEIDVEVIADGAHLPEALLKLIVKIKGREKIALVTDAMRAAGTKVSTSYLGSKSHGLEVIIEDEVAKLPDRSAFAGSVATADRLVRTMVELAGVSIPDAVYMMSTTPARIMGVQNKMGSIEKGKFADLVLFDDNIQIQQTFIGGQPIM
ncbi:N-acetylglucosamine-6-phosphate deacetylase [Flavihumibacter sp. UBA7668]|uniref:N-acetylglucosamine-6-phosphate deacetylase n=1 Tax=Flavihumibacter sp. UBA7668 TaxID=1946542 RepID=UPI0025BBA4AA|nr:N-acetylglucosamine-6-phosphate deacetylase [Flavihumibacter sp. UBA7668]